MQEYFANFIKTGDPNGAGLPAWPTFKKELNEFLRADEQTGSVAPD